MRGRLARIVAALAIPLTLSSCFITPGTFGSTLDLRRDGSFAFSYKGEILFQSPDALMKMGEKPEDQVWSDDKATCYNDVGASDAAASNSDQVTAAAEEMSAAADNATAAAGSATTATSDDEAAEAAGSSTRKCTPKEIADQKKDWEESRKAREDKAKRDATQFGAIFGYTPGDDAANKKLAAQIMKFEGWKSVVYKGDGVFAVDYAATGRLDHDFVFPLLPQSDLVFPFVIVKRQANGAVRVAAPALIGGGLKALATRMKGIGAAMTDKEVPQSTKTKGTFTVTTDGEVMTNNTEEGAERVATGRQLVWEIGPDSEKVPEALIRLR
jgi:hypothetical protein